MKDYTLQTHPNTHTKTHSNTQTHTHTHEMYTYPSKINTIRHYLSSIILFAKLLYNCWSLCLFASMNNEMTHSQYKIFAVIWAISNPVKFNNIFYGVKRHNLTSNKPAKLFLTSEVPGTFPTFASFIPLSPFFCAE